MALFKGTQSEAAQREAKKVEFRAEIKGSFMGSGDSVEIYGLPETSSRLSLKKMMEAFGEVVGCHIGNRGVDFPVIRFQAPASAESCLTALNNKQVYMDGVVLDGGPRGAKPPPGAKQGETGTKRRSTYDEDPAPVTSRELYQRGRGGAEGSRGNQGRSRSRGRR